MIKQVPIICDSCRAEEMTFESIVENNLKITNLFCPCGFGFKEVHEREEVWANVTTGENCEPMLVGMIWSPVKKTLTK